ncbi:MAG TPA: RNA pseudouridine synthase [Candidatus Krumholzibacteria bacterium]|nr:RNA pseudouridine synthase [Candidatus Krumholzibacteria bacterium]
MSDLEILYEDNHVLGVLKPAGMLSQGDRTGDLSALELARRYIKEKHDKPGNVFVGLVQRLDRPVSGVMIIARTSKAASRLSRAFHDRDVEKTYLCVVSGRVEKETGELSALIERAHKRSRITETESARSKAATLEFRVLGRFTGEEIRGLHPRAPRDPAEMTLLEVRPRTGRHHQIRLQLSAAGHVIRGDIKYGAVTPLPDKSIALHAVRLRAPHPVRDDFIDLSAPPPHGAPWTHFSAAIKKLLSEYAG